MKLFKPIFMSESQAVYTKFRKFISRVIACVSIEAPPQEFCATGFYWKLREEIEIHLDDTRRAHQATPSG